MAKLGQHFLTDKNILRKIVSAAEISENDAILEIGAGTGTLTAVLTERAKRVVAVEKDAELYALLCNKFACQKNVELVCRDIIKFDPAKYQLESARYKIVANIPYYITGRIIRLMFESWPRPSSAALVLQKEVAKRIVCKPPKMNRLSAIVQYFSSPRIISVVAAGSFRPRPDVDSAIVALSNIRPNKPRDSFAASVIATGFSHPRKLLASNLKKRFSNTSVISAFDALSLPADARPSMLERKDWERLSTLLFAKT